MVLAMIDYPPPAALIKFLKPYDPEVRELALQLRLLLLEEIAPCYENIYDAYSAVAIGYGTSDRLREFWKGKVIGSGTSKSAPPRISSGRSCVPTFAARASKHLQMRASWANRRRKNRTA
jgi:hypothetical protein